MIDALLEGLRDELNIIHIRMDFSRHVHENRIFRIGKVGRLFKLIHEARSALKEHPGAILYYPPAPARWMPVLRDMFFLICCRRLAGKTVFHFHAYGLGGFLDRRRWLRRPWMRPDAAVVLGNACRGDAELLDSKKVYVIPYGIDVPIHQSVGNEAVDELRILFVGHHLESKGVFDLLETARLLSLRNIKFAFRLAGEWMHPADRERFFLLKKRYNLDSSVTCLESLQGEDLWKEYAKADIFFFPTFYEYETFGVVVLEAMAHGLPVVASNWRGPADIVRHGETGFICDVHDVSAYSDAIEKLFSDVALRSRMGRAAERVYVENFTAQGYIEAMRNVFVEV